jgi:transcriptional regulator with XRE-family HTH domain
MNLTNFPLLIYKTRRALGETQATFAKRFKASHASASHWENGESEAPYEVLYFCIRLTQDKNDFAPPPEGEPLFLSARMVEGYTLTKEGRDLIMRMCKFLATEVS